MDIGQVFMPFFQGDKYNQHCKEAASNGSIDQGLEGLYEIGPVVLTAVVHPEDDGGSIVQEGSSGVSHRSPS